ncbi:MAG TPA: NUDIX domain-containing protein [Polyangiales bacterium]|nr:NUDIX domain-containing protein [Polyangiales bacterium]
MDQQREELVDIVDEDDHVIGRATRTQMRRDKLLHRVVAILCRNRDGKIYVHRRTATKDLFPSLYDMFTAGTVEAGESYELAAIRELEEELGIRGVTLEPLFRHRYEGDRTRSHTAVYSVEWNGPIVHQAAEIAWGEFQSRAELSANLERFEFVPDGVELFTRYIAAYPDRL